MPPAILQPTTITLEADAIRILWTDGHHSLYPHRYLRGNCPCAGCVHEMTGKRVVGVKDVAVNVQAVDQMTIGRYAIQLLWSDAHDTGIYTYLLLRKLCQCSEHRQLDATP